jgi:hypothetical protein
MTPRKRQRAILDCGRWTATVAGPASAIVPAVQQACGRDYHLEYDNRARRIRIPAGKAADVLAALEAAKVSVVLKGRPLLKPELFG